MAGKMTKWFNAYKDGDLVVDGGEEWEIEWVDFSTTAINIVMDCHLLSRRGKRKVVSITAPKEKL